MQTFSQQGTLQDTVIVGAMDLIKSSTKKRLNAKNLVIFTLLRQQYPTDAHIFTHSANLAFWTKSGFKNEVRALARFGLQNEIRSQLCTVPSQSNGSILSL